MKRNGLKGFTLVEILLALAILGIGLVSILSVFVVGTNSIRRTIAMTEASFIAQMVIEDYKQEGYDNVKSETINKFYDYTQINQIYPDYSCITDVVDKADGVPSLKLVNLTIKHKEKNLLKFTTYIAKYEP